jgi:hypothetical protein
LAAAGLKLNGRQTYIEGTRDRITVYSLAIPPELAELAARVAARRAAKAAERAAENVNYETASSSIVSRFVVHNRHEQQPITSPAAHEQPVTDRINLALGIW